MTKTKIIVSIIIALILFSSAIIVCSTALDVRANDTEFSVQPMIEFYDNKIQDYTIEDLAWLIREYHKIQNTTQDLINNAISLGFPEGDRTIEIANIQKSNTQVIIDYYTEHYNQKLNEKQRLIAESEYPVATEIWNFMKAQGWNDYVCAGIMGNIMAEVGGQSFNIRYDAYGDGYYGICQWNRGYGN